MLRMATIIILLAVTGRGDNPRSAMDGVAVHLRLMQRHGDKTDFELTISNKRADSIYVMTNPQRSDKSLGPYFEIDEKDSALLRCVFRTYPSPPYELYVNGASVKLKLLHPGEQNREVFSLTVPVMRTVPPYGNEPGNEPAVLPNQFRRIEAVVGILPATEGLNKLFEKLGSHLVHGQEPIAPDQLKPLRVFEAQALLTSNAVNF